MTAPAPAPTSASTARRNRNRGMLILIVVIFLGSALIAGVLRFSGWRPEGTRNHGELLQPPGDLREMQLRMQDGGDYPWDPDARIWRITLAPPVGCDAPCVELAADLDLVWQLFGRHADRVHTLWAGEVPEGIVSNRSLRVIQADPALRAALPGVDDPAGVPVYVIDPNGFVILRYAPGFDPGDLRSDMVRLLRLD